MMTYFHYKVKVKGHDLGHYPAKLLKHFRFVQNVFTFLDDSLSDDSIIPSTSERYVLMRNAMADKAGNGLFVKHH